MNHYISKVFVALFLFCMPFLVIAQKTASVSGTVLDTTSKSGLKNAVIMATKIADSSLVSFTRSDEKGLFNLNKLPIDTFQITISHPSFSDKYFLVVASEKNNVYDFGKIIMPPKNVELNEVVIYATKDPVYYKGDTLIYTADSFKVGPNANVEDLIKKLPGMKVGADGKISFQGKQIDQVFVDGDEFFGTDPTIATKNLNANAIESVQVYDKEKDAAAGNDAETTKVMNLKLKEEAKKGYFGKIAGASDFMDYYEGEFLANKFTSKQKISVFGLYSNTPRSGFDWDDVFKYGLADMESNDDGNRTYYYDGAFDSPNGVPKTGSGGINYSDKYGKNTKVTSSYTYGNNELNSESETSSQYFLPDTSYTVDSKNNSYQRSESHKVKIGLVQKLDSLTELEFSSTYKTNTNKKYQADNTLFYSDENIKTRGTSINNVNSAQNDDFSGYLRLRKSFKKKDRKLYTHFGYAQNDQEYETILKTTETFYVSSGTGNNIDQKKNTSGNKNSIRANAKYTEPLSKKIKLSFLYDYTMSVDKQNKNAFDFFNGEYTLPNDSFSNSFETNRSTNLLGLMFDYEVKTKRFYIGSDLRQVNVLNDNLITGKKIKQDIKNVLPYANYRYKINSSSTLEFRYRTTSSQPSIFQLQPVPDNSNPNNITLGNPDLLPTYTHDMSATYSFHKPISGKNLWTRLSYEITNNAFANKTYFDTLGRRVTQMINVPYGLVEGEYYLWGGFPLFSNLLQLEPEINASYKKSTSYINNLENITQEWGTTSGLGISMEKKKFSGSIRGSFSYRDPRSTISIQSNQPYTNQVYSCNLHFKFPKKFILNTDAAYTSNTRRSEGYNINYLIWNMTVEKSFLKKDNLIASISAKDILNQNISTKRTVNDNVIVDNKTSVIGRYIMARVTYKFNSNKAKEEDEEF